MGFRIRKYVNKNNFRDKIGEIISIKSGHNFVIYFIYSNLLII